jgi:hypothetical protein
MSGTDEENLRKPLSLLTSSKHLPNKGRYNQQYVYKKMLRAKDYVKLPHSRWNRSKEFQFDFHRKHKQYMSLNPRNTAWR